MPYKRFKTYFLEYLNRDQRLNDLELLYYLDIDVVVGQPLHPWFRYVETNYLFQTKDNVDGNNNNKVPSNCIFQRQLRDEFDKNKSCDRYTRSIEL